VVGDPSLFTCLHCSHHRVMLPSHQAKQHRPAHHRSLLAGGGPSRPNVRRMIGNRVQSSNPVIENELEQNRLQAPTGVSTSAPPYLTGPPWPPPTCTLSVHTGPRACNCAAWHPVGSTDLISPACTGPSCRALPPAAEDGLPPPYTASGALTAHRPLTRPFNMSKICLYIECYR
jgi:hypothetical protein